MLTEYGFHPHYEYDYVWETADWIRVVVRPSDNGGWEAKTWGRRDEAAHPGDTPTAAFEAVLPALLPTLNPPLLVVTRGEVRREVRERYVPARFVRVHAVLHPSFEFEEVILVDPFAHMNLTEARAAMDWIRSIHAKVVRFA